LKIGNTVYFAETLFISRKRWVWHEKPSETLFISEKRWFEMRIHCVRDAKPRVKDLTKRFSFDPGSASVDKPNGNAEAPWRRNDPAQVEAINPLLLQENA
jgi:hypothetical protein